MCLENKTSISKQKSCKKTLEQMTKGIKYHVLVSACCCVSQLFRDLALKLPVSSSKLSVYYLHVLLNCRECIFIPPLTKLVFVIGFEHWIVSKFSKELPFFYYYSCALLF